MIDWISLRARETNDFLAARFRLLPGYRDQAPPKVIRSYLEVQNHFVTWMIEQGFIRREEVEIDGKRDNRKAARQFAAWWQEDPPELRERINQYLAGRLAAAMAEHGIEPDDGVALADADGAEARG